MHLPLLTTEFLDRAVDLHADRVGVVADDGTEYTYGEFGERVNRLSNALDDLGLEKGDRLAILAPNTHWFMESLYAAAKLGVIFVPLNYRLTPSDYNYILNDCEAKAIIADYEYADKIEGIRDQVSTEHHIAYKPDKVKGDWTGYESLLSDYSPDEPQRPDIDETDDASIIYTSGTTGDPKGVVHTYRVQYLHALIHAHHMEVEDDDTILWTSPMFHINGWGHIFTVTGIGGKHVCLRAFDPAEVFRRIPEYDVTFFGAAPTVLNMLIDYYENNDVETQGSKPVRVETAASAPPKATIRTTEDEIGWRILHAYGATETGPLITTSNSHRLLEEGDKFEIKNKQGFETLNTRIRVVDEDGNDVPKDDETMGEIVAKGHQVMDRYWNKPQQTEEAFNARVEGWFHTGDIATIDENGMITVVDRKKDVIISGGENISSIEVEDVLYDHPDIEKVAVIPVPHEKWGETPKAIVVRREGSSLTEDDVIEFARDRLAHYKCPTSVEFVEGMPETATGKIQKYELREEYWEGKERRIG